MDVDGHRIPAGSEKLKKLNGDRLLVEQPIPFNVYTYLQMPYSYSIPFVDSTFPANRSSNIVA
jgi:hypothetical protein